MDIKFNMIQQISQVKKYQNTTRATAATPTMTQAADKVDFSDSGKLFAQAMKQAMSTPEVRESRVSELRDQIKSGTYNVSGRDIAAKMLGSFNVN